MLPRPGLPTIVNTHHNVASTGLAKYYDNSKGDLGNRRSRRSWPLATQLKRLTVTVMAFRAGQASRARNVENNALGTLVFLPVAGPR